MTLKEETIEKITVRKKKLIGTGIAKTILKKNKWEGRTFPNSKAQIAVVVKTDVGEGRDTQISGTEPTVRPIQICPPDFDRGAKVSCQSRDNLTTNGAGAIEHLWMRQ